MTARLVVVGAGAAGTAAALAARDAGHDGAISLVGAEPHVPYERPPLSKDYRCAPVPLTDPAAFAERDIELRLGVGVRGLDVATREVELDGGERLGAAAVLLATGARPRPLTCPGAELPGVGYLRTADDAAWLARALTPAAPLVVVGGGFIGLELAAAARTAGIDVTVVEADPEPLTRVVGPRLGAALRAHHEAAGVRVRCGAAVEAVVGGERAEGVRLAGGEVVPAGTVVAGIGVLPATELVPERAGLAREGGVAAGGGVPVDACGRTAHPWLFAAGDVAAGPVGGGHARVEHWNVALGTGAAAGRAMAATITTGAEPAPHRATPYFWSDQYDLRIQVHGRPPVGRDPVLRGDPASGSFTAFWLGDGRVEAVAAISRPQEARAGRALIERAVPVTPAALGDEHADLRALARA